MQRIKDILDYLVFENNGREIRIVDLLILVAITLVVVLVYAYLRRSLIPRLMNNLSVRNPQEIRKLLRWIKYIVLLVITEVLIETLDQNYSLLTYKDFNLRVTTVINVLIIFQCARILIWLITNAYVEASQRRGDIGAELKASAASREAAERTIRWIVYLAASIFILSQIQLEPIFTIDRSAKADENTYNFFLNDVLKVILTFLVARVVVWMSTQVILRGYYHRRSIKPADQYVLNQLFKYLVYTVSIIVAFNLLGINTTLLLGGAAALLVGLGLGLQQTFNDFFSGLLLLTERRIEIGDMIQVEGMMGEVRRIGLRTTVVLNLDEISVIVPNSKLVIDEVINYSQEQKRSRFSVVVGVEYGSDIELVERLLLESTAEEDLIYRHPPPTVLFQDFGDSALTMELFFYVSEFHKLPAIRNRLRRRIYKLFAQHDVGIPFPQRDVHIKGGGA